MGESTISPQLHVLLAICAALLVTSCLLQYPQGMEVTVGGTELSEEELAYLGDDDENEGFHGWEGEEEAENKLGVNNVSDAVGISGVSEEEDREFFEELDEADVVVLGGGNFSEFVTSNLYVLVEFYAPWCHHCKALAPEYAEAASDLKGLAHLAKVDATTNSELAEQYEVESYPTIVFFYEGRPKTYYVGRTKDEIVNWVKKKTGPRVSRLSSWTDAETVVKSLKSTMAIALFDKLEGPENLEYTRAARLVDGVYFFETDVIEAAAVFNLSEDAARPALVLLKQEQEKISWFDGVFNRDAIEEFLEKNKLPLVTTFNRETAVSIFESSIKKQIILLASADDYSKLIPGFREASKALRDKLVFVYADLDDSEQAPGILQFFGTSRDKPSVVGYDTEDVTQKFLLEGDITEANVKAFGESFLSSELQPRLKSEPIPEAINNDVKIVVGANFDAIVLDDAKDVFLEVYAPWCGHCQELQPIWEKLAAKLRGVKSVVIAKMDGTTNEHPKVKVEGFPTLLLFPAGKADREPVVFEGRRTVKSLARFLKRESSIPFVIQVGPTDPQGISTNASAETEATGYDLKDEL